MTNGTRTSLTHVAIGLCIMGLGVVLVLDRLQILDAVEALQFWPAALILIGAAFVLEALRGGPDRVPGSGSRFPLGAVIWLVLLGLFFSHVFERRGSAAREDGKADIHLFAMMSGARRASAGEPFHGAEMTSVMGGTQLDLREAAIAPGEEAVVDVFALMGGAVIFMPRDWTLDIQTVSVMGGVKDERAGTPAGTDRRRGRGRGRDTDIDDTPAPEPAAPAPAPQPPPPSDLIERDDRTPVDTRAAGKPPHIVLRGYVMMGGLVIRS